MMYPPATNAVASIIFGTKSQARRWLWMITSPTIANIVVLNFSKTDGKIHSIRLNKYLVISNRK
jgi:hypothetical protein